MKTKIPLLACLLLVGPFVSPLSGETLVINDSFTAPDEAGFTATTGINKDIGTRLTGSLAGVGLRYIQTGGTKPAEDYSINADTLKIVNSVDAIGRFTLSDDGATPFDFASALGTASATPANPVVYDVRISMKKNSTTGHRFSFGIATAEGDVTVLDFGVQLLRSGSSSRYQLQRRIDIGSSGVDDINASIGNTALNQWPNNFVDYLIRVTDAGAESGGDYNSRVQVSINNGSTWIYDTENESVELPNGWRFDGAGRIIVFDVAGGSVATVGDVFYDDFSITLAPSRVKTWDGSANANWENAGNWEEGAAPTTGDALVFTGTTLQINNNNRSAANLSALTSITFDNGGFVLQQNALTILNALTNLAGDNAISNAITINDPINVHTESGNLALSGAVDGTGSITKSGAGSLDLKGENIYSGDTTINEGGLIVNNTAGSATGSGNISVDADAFIGGSGTVSGTVTLSGTVSPGNSVGTLTTGAETWNSGGAYEWEIDDATGTSGTSPGWDKLTINGALTIAATPESQFNLNVSSIGTAANFDKTAAQEWIIASATGGITGDTAAINVTSTGFSNDKSDGYFGVAVAVEGNDLVLNFTPLEAVADGVSRSGSAVEISVASLLVNDIGTGLSFTTNSSTSAEGGQIESGGAVIYYNPPAGNPGVASDTFTYTVTDANGKTSVGTVTLTNEGSSGVRVLNMTTAGQGKFQGIPNTAYLIEFADSLDEPVDWQPLTTVGVNGVVTTDGSGLGQFNDETDPSPEQRYYRIVAP